MGDMADFALGHLMDWDEQVQNGYYDDVENWEDGMSMMIPFSSRKRKPSGPGSCPVCKGTTVKRSGPHGDFYGCQRFPKCKGNRNG